MDVPRWFCWTKFGAESGEAPGEIVQRKELERRNNDGVFLWGIGNSIAPALSDLLEVQEDPAVLFSPMVSRPRDVDVAPDGVRRWIVGERLDGRRYDVPRNCIVTSRLGARSFHYALVCCSDMPLRLAEDIADGLDVTSLRNFASGRPLGGSQVTAVVEKRRTLVGGGRLYPVALSARLVYPYLVRLTESVKVHSLEFTGLRV